MKQYSKVGNRPGRPAYRTSARFRYQQYIKIKNAKIQKFNKQGKIVIN